MTPDKPEGVWIDYKPGDPAPTLPVRVRQRDGREATRFLDGKGWFGWDRGFITAYMIQPGAAKATGQGGDA